MKDIKMSSIFIEDYKKYISNMSTYIAKLEERLFSEGLYEIGGKSTPQNIAGYMDAVFEGRGILFNIFN